MGDVTTSLLQLVLQETGNNTNNWGEILNDTLQRIEDAIANTNPTVTTGGTTTLTDDQALAMIQPVTGVLGSNALIQVPDHAKAYLFRNGTTGSYTLTVQRASGGTSAVIPQGVTAFVFCDGSNVYTSATLPDTQANLTVLSNISGGVAAASANTLSQILDAIIGSTRGSQITRQSGGWAGVSPSTAGYVWRDGGAGADPSWVGGITRLSSGAADAVAALDLTIPSTYSSFRLILRNFYSVTNTVSMGLRVSFDSGASYQSGANSYGYAGRVGTPSAIFGDIGGTNTYGYFAGSMNNVLSNSFAVIDFQPGTAFANFCYISNSVYTNAGTVYCQWVNGQYGGVGRITNLRLLYNSGNIGHVDYELYGIS